MTERHYWDACVWVDLINTPEGQSSAMTTLWGALERGSLEVMYSAITLAEVLNPEGGSRPWADPHDADLLFEVDGLVLVQVDRQIGERARSIRRRHAMKLGDAFHLACALTYNAEYLVTRDQRDLLKLPPQYRADGQPLKVVTPADVLGGPLFQIRPSET